MNVPVICGFARTPVGKYKGSLSEFSAVDLGSMAVTESVSYTHLTLPTNREV